MKTIWLVNYYAMPPKLESRLRTIKFAYYLKKEGYNIRIIGSSAMHNKKINLIDGRCSFIETSYDGIDFIHIKSPSYNSSGMIRFLSLLIFHLRLHILRKRFTKPDVIIHTALPPFGNITFFTARRLGAKYIVEVLDLWPESFVAFGLISKSNPLLVLAYRAERWLYSKADEVVFSMEGGRDYIMEKKWNQESGGPIDMKKIYYINNGVDLDEFEHDKAIYKINDEILQDDSIFKVIYLGSIRLANNLKLLIEAAAKLTEYKNVIFLIYGNGDDRKYLERYCIDNNISNVVFKQKWVDIKYVPYILSRSSLNILNYKPTSVWKYGGSQSKSFQYMASGKPICSNLQMGYCPITKYNLGIAKEFKTSEEYASAILKFVNMESKDYNKICENNLNAVKFYDYKKLTKEFEKIVLM